MSDSEEEYQSGPFCRHWSDPSDCPVECAKCGHGCTRHAAEDGERNCFECGCPAWVEPEVKPEVKP